LQQAAAVSPKGSRNLLPPEQSYVQFLQQQVRPARALLHAHGLKGFHDLRAAYACERYLQLTGHAAPVNGGRCLDRTLDRSARRSATNSATTVFTWSPPTSAASAAREQRYEVVLRHGAVSDCGA
jgi:hypothetical protein